MLFEGYRVQYIEMFRPISTKALVLCFSITDLLELHQKEGIIKMRKALITASHAFESCSIVVFYLFFLPLHNKTNTILFVRTFLGIVIPLSVVYLCEFP